MNYRLRLTIKWLSLSWRWLGFLASTAQSGYDLGSADQIVRVYPQRPAHEAEQDYRADTYAAPTTDAAGSLSAAILYSVAARQLIQAHCLSPALAVGEMSAM